MSPKGAYALIQLSNGYAKEVIDLVKRLPTVRSVEAVRGPYQLIAEMSVQDATALQRIDGVERVVTAVRAPSSSPRLRRHQVIELEPKEMAGRLCGSPA